MDIYRNVIGEKIRILSDEKKILFSLLICEKLLPNYIFFSTKYKYGNPSELEAIISELYRNLLEKTKNSDIDNYIDSVENITPDTQDFHTILVSFALDACTSILSSLFFLRDNNVEHVIDVAIYARDTVYMYIQERDNIDVYNDELEFKLENDSFMQIEKKRQNDVIKYLNGISSIDQNDIARLRNLQPQSIIDLNYFKQYS